MNPEYTSSSIALCLGSAVGDVDEEEDDPAESMSLDACRVVSNEEMRAAADRQKASHRAFGQLLRSKVRIACVDIHSRLHTCSMSGHAQSPLTEQFERCHCCSTQM